MFEFFALLFRTVRLAHITNTVQLWKITKKVLISLMFFARCLCRIFDFAGWPARCEIRNQLIPQVTEEDK